MSDRDTVAWAYRDSTNRLAARIHDRRLAQLLAEEHDDYHVSWADGGGDESDG
jgi:hypothetical protein